MTPEMGRPLDEQDRRSSSSQTTYFSLIVISFCRNRNRIPVEGGMKVTGRVVVGIQR